MSNLDEIQSTPLQVAFREARRAAGKQAVHMVLVAHGAVTGMLEDVPQAKRAACLIALQKLARDGGEVDHDTRTDASFADIRKRAFGERRQSPRTIDATAIYENWNSSVRPNED